MFNDVHNKMLGSKSKKKEVNQNKENEPIYMCMCVYMYIYIYIYGIKAVFQVIFFLTLCNSTF